MWLIAVFISAVLSSIADILENENFFTSRFKNLNPKFWYKRESWKYAKKIFNYTFDGWHITKSLMVVSFLTIPFIYIPLMSPLWDFIIAGVVFSFTMEYSYRFWENDKKSK